MSSQGHFEEHEWEEAVVVVMQIPSSVCEDEIVEGQEGEEEQEQKQKQKQKQQARIRQRD